MQPQGLRRGAHSPIEPAQSANSLLATSAQAISSTNPTAPNNAKKQRLDVVQAADFHNRPHLGGNVLVCVGVLDGKSLGQRAEFQPCRLERHAIAKARLEFRALAERLA